MRYFLLSLVSFLSLSLMPYTHVWAHGGIPRVLSITPPKNAQDHLWVIDTLGVFKGITTEELSTRNWAWLCDDAIDPALGVDDLLIIDEQVMVAIAKSGLYRSEDGGCQFLRINSDVSDQALGIISAHPTRTHELVVYTDSISQENSVWWSTDQGLTWTRSTLAIEGTIYKLWRSTQNPDQIWVNHALGLSLSIDGGQHFQTIETQGYGLDVSPHEVRLIGGGQLADKTALFIALNRYPTASLLLSVDQGQTWRVIHQAEDSYESLLLTDHALWVSTPFEGLFTFPLSERERTQNETAWTEGWIQKTDQFISCLVADPLNVNRVWGCGRSSPTDWIVAYSDNLGDTWTTVMDRYGDASQNSWGCSPNATSLLACQTRCLEEGCDPSGLESPMMSSIMPEEEIVNEMGSEQNQAPPSSEMSGCTGVHQDSSHWLPLTLIFILLPAVRRSQRNLSE